MKHPLFSCVIPVKGERPYFDEALESLCFRKGWVMTDGGWWIGRLRGFYSLAEGRGDAGLGQIC
jgi:hypothetical protein